MFNILIKQTKFLRPIFSYTTQKQLLISKIAEKINARIKDSQVIVEEKSEQKYSGTQINIHVESMAFHDKSLVEQHKMVKEAIWRQLKDIQSVHIMTKVKHIPSQRQSSNGKSNGNHEEDRRTNQSAEIFSQVDNAKLNIESSGKSFSDTEVRIDVAVIDTGN